MTHATTSGTQTSHINRSSGCRGTTPGCLRVLRRTRTIMTPTHSQYAQIVAVSTAAGRSFIDVFVAFACGRISASAPSRREVYRLLRGAATRPPAAGSANSRSISRRIRTASPPASIWTSLQRTGAPAATGVDELHVVREPERQPAEPERIRRREELAVHRVAALAVEHLAGLQIALRGRDDVGAKTGRARPVGSPRNPTDATEMPTSSPIRCQRLYRQA